MNLKYFYSSISFHKHIPFFYNSVLILLAFICISCSATRLTQRHIESRFLESPEFKQGFSGFALYDPASGKMLYTHNAEKFFTPASNTKLFTLYTGLKILGDSMPALKYTVRADSLIFKGTGDPSFLNPELPDSGIFNFLTTTDKKLFYTPPIFKEKSLGSGWAWDDYDSYYSTEKVDFPIYGNLMKIQIKRNSEMPIIEPAIFKDSLIITPVTEPKNRHVQREIASNRMKYQKFKRDKELNQSIPLKFSNNLIAELLTDTLKRKVEIYKGNLENLNFNKTLYSIPADSVYKRMMQVSDNFIAEQILLMAADKISDTLKTSIAIDYMKENYLKDLRDEPMWYDGSGLSRYNLFTPRAMVKLIEKIEMEMPKEKLFKILAAGGESGTLKNYYKAETPYIYAKTGTLRNNHSLSGFLLTKSGRILIFSFMNSNYTVPTSELKQGMTSILEMIRDNY